MIRQRHGALFEEPTRLEGSFETRTECRLDLDTCGHNGDYFSRSVPSSAGHRILEVAFPLESAL